MPDIALGERLLLLLPVNGQAKNTVALARALGVEVEELVPTLEALRDQGKVEITETGLRVRRGPETLGQLSDAAAEFLSHLPDDGTCLARRELVAIVGEAAVNEAVGQLVNVGRVRVEGHGWGTQYGRVDVEDGDDVEDGPSTPGVDQERELYEPFRAWLQENSWSAGRIIAFHDVALTDSPAGHPRRSGKWTRPDVTEIQVSQSEWLPGSQLEVRTYEIKKASDAKKLEGLYEALAHRRFAHRSSLVLEIEPGAEIDEAIVDEVTRHGLGLFRIWLESNGADAVMEIAPRRHDPDPLPLEDLVRRYFEEHRPAQRATYLRSI